MYMKDYVTPQERLNLSCDSQNKIKELINEINLINYKEIIDKRRKMQLEDMLHAMKIKVN